ncbi:MAG: hypothetical protein ACOY4K_16910 [Pseudomonadota bacterium]
MNRTIDRLKLIFLGLFALGAAGIWAYQIFYVVPARKCESHGGWWDGRTRLCGAVIYIPSITGRPAGVSRREWSEQQAARRNQAEAEGRAPGALPDSGPGPSKAREK